MSSAPGATAATLDRPLSMGGVLPMTVIAAQLGVLALLVRVLHIESAAFYDWVVPLAFGGWLVHHLLPLRWRLSFFAGLSIASILLIFRLPGLWIVGIGLALIAVARAPLRTRHRVALILVIVAGLAALRAGVLAAPIPVPVWPILGSMFMFRLIGYLYDAQHSKTPPTWTQALAYFFCLPNVAFPLFPVIDFATFRRTYYDRDAIGIYQQGVAWMARGVLHLVLYRLVYQHGTLSPAEVSTFGDLVRYILANFALYLRVSGQFHLIVGMLHLFGFRLPETHHFFFLAGSFTDFWRRINIYWKEFMQKVVFNPAYFPLRKRWGERPALVVATLAVFTATWFFHSYQWFWLLGTWLWSLTDTLFWGILAVLLVVNVLRETARGRARSLGAPAWSAARAAGVGLRTAGTFAVLALLWTLWTSPTLADFAALMRVDRVDAAGVAAAAAVLLLIGLGGIVTARWSRTPRPAPMGLPSLGTVAVLASLTLICVAGAKRLNEPLPVVARAALRDVRLAELNRQDAAQLQRGYYENIVGVNRFNGQLWEVYAQRARSMPSLTELGILRLTKDELHVELVPLAGAVFHGSPVRINAWGMRDRDYTDRPAPQTYRISLLGQSYVMGMGVGDGETFESLLESALNASPAESDGRRYEILNFAVPRYSLFQQLHLLEHGRALGAGPHAVLLVGHSNEPRRMVEYLHAALARGTLPASDLVRATMDSAGVTADVTYDEFARRMRPYAFSLVEWGLRSMADTIRRAGAVPAYAFIPMPLDEIDDALHQRLLDAAAQAGFAVIDLADVYADRDPRSYMVAEWERHPNAEGHRTIARRLHDPLMKVVGTGLGTRDAGLGMQDTGH